MSRKQARHLHFTWKSQLNTSLFLTGSAFYVTAGHNPAKPSAWSKKDSPWPQFLDLLFFRVSTSSTLDPHIFPDSWLQGNLNFFFPIKLLKIFSTCTFHLIPKPLSHSPKFATAAAYFQCSAPVSYGCCNKLQKHTGLNFTNLLYSIGQRRVWKEAE